MTRFLFWQKLSPTYKMLTRGMPPKVESYNDLLSARDAYHKNLDILKGCFFPQCLYKISYKPHIDGGNINGSYHYAYLLGSNHVTANRLFGDTLVNLVKSTKVFVSEIHPAQISGVISYFEHQTDAEDKSAYLIQDDKSVNDELLAKKDDQKLNYFAALTPDTRKLVQDIYNEADPASSDFSIEGIFDKIMRATDGQFYPCDALDVELARVAIINGNLVGGLETHEDRTNATREASKNASILQSLKGVNPLLLLCLVPCYAIKYVLDEIWEACFGKSDHEKVKDSLDDHENNILERIELRADYVLGKMHVELFGTKIFCTLPYNLDTVRSTSKYLDGDDNRPDPTSAIDGTDIRTDNWKPIMVEIIKNYQSTFFCVGKAHIALDRSHENLVEFFENHPDFEIEHITSAAMLGADLIGQEDCTVIGASYIA